MVDDEPFIRGLTRRILSGLGVESFLEASSGSEALSILKACGKSTELILCDLMMPDMDGIELVRHLSELPHPPAIAFLSGADDMVLKAACSLANARLLNVLGAVSKPISHEEILPILKRLEQRAVRPSSGPTLKIGKDDLERGIKADEFVLHYQPKVSLKSLSLSSVEALVRWEHPEHGMIFPDSFIELAESTLLIAPMTEKLVELSFRQLQKWETVGLLTRVALNLSPAMLFDTELPDRLSRLAASLALDPSRIIFEITETGAPSDEAVFLEIVTRLHMHGFVISIDDFGTGRSSLLNLEALPFSELKIDRAFVDGAAQDNTKRNILKASVGLAKSLNLKIVAEGVEHLEDWDLVTELGCDIVQGYFVSRPLPAADLPLWVTQWQSQHKGRKE
nr:EAL domain-containing response regulator [Leisingera sp. MMG026]